MSRVGESRLPVRRRWFRRHPVLTLAALNLALLVGFGAVFELLFRRQVVDFYARELSALNHPRVLSASTPPPVLVLGDSFAAARDSFASRLSTSEPGAPRRVVNSAVTGTTILHAARIADRRIERFEPRLVIYQAYAGNDLLDLAHPVSWRRVGPARNLYWLLLDSGATGLGFLNYRAGQMWNRAKAGWRQGHGGDPRERVLEERARPFSVDEYRQREKMLLAADPSIIHRQIAVDGMDNAWSRYRTALERLIGVCEARDTPLVVVVVPHCTQVGERYRKRFHELGAGFPRHDLLEARTYPMLERIREVAARYDAVRVLDPLAELRQAEGHGPPVYQNNDAHLSDCGHEVLAGYISRRLDGCNGPG